MNIACQKLEKCNLILRFQINLRNESPPGCLPVAGGRLGRGERKVSKHLDPPVKLVKINTPIQC